MLLNNDETFREQKEYKSGVLKRLIGVINNPSQRWPGSCCLLLAGSGKSKYHHEYKSGTFKRLIGELAFDWQRWSAQYRDSLTGIAKRKLTDSRKRKVNKAA